MRSVVDPSVNGSGVGGAIADGISAVGAGLDTDSGVQILRAISEKQAGILVPEAFSFVAQLHRRFEPMRRALLTGRRQRAAALAAGEKPDFLEETRQVRVAEWKVAEAPHDLLDRRVEITGPASRKMMINALNSGAQVYMADLEDSMSPTWGNVVDAQVNLWDAVRRKLELVQPNGKQYSLGEDLATLVVRPRGWHLTEKNVLIDGEEVSASLLDFGLYFFLNAHELLHRGSGPYFYLPKLESHLEARLWNDVFLAAQAALDIPRGTVRATVLIETLLAAFEMEEILFELAEHSSGLNAGRWDYIFSAIRNFHHRDFVFPDRAQITMEVPFMKAYAELLVQTCHRRGAHAIGGMAAFIPSRRDPQVNERALAKIRLDKQREARQGSDGSWVAHPDLVPVVREIFDRTLGDRPHQKDVLREDLCIQSSQLLDFAVPGGRLTEQGLRLNINVALQYLDAWLQGVGAASIHNLMEDAATAEISRAQLWQWIRWGAELEAGGRVTAELYRTLRQEEFESLASSNQGGTRRGSRPESQLVRAAQLLDRVVLAEDFKEFLTLEAYGDIE